jgi:hypothetical protein
MASRAPGPSAFLDHEGILPPVIASHRRLGHPISQRPHSASGTLTGHRVAICLLLHPDIVLAKRTLNGCGDDGIEEKAVQQQRNESDHDRSSEVAVVVRKGWVHHPRVAEPASSHEPHFAPRRRPIPDVICYWRMPNCSLPATEILV